MKWSGSLALVFGVFLAGCPGSIADPERFGGPLECDLSDVHAELVVPTCATNAACHMGENPAGSLSLVGDDFSGLVDAAPTDKCSDFKIIDSSNNEESLLLQITLDPAPCSIKMPLTGDPLTEKQRVCLTDWVTEIARGEQ